MEEVEIECVGGDDVRPEHGLLLGRSDRGCTCLSPPCTCPECLPADDLPMRGIVPFALCKCTVARSSPLSSRLPYNPILQAPAQTSDDRPVARPGESSNACRRQQHAPRLPLDRQPDHHVLDFPRPCHPTSINQADRSTGRRTIGSHCKFTELT
jgi:hypothetical protein